MSCHGEGNIYEIVDDDDIGIANRQGSHHGGVAGGGGDIVRGSSSGDVEEAGVVGVADQGADAVAEHVGGDDVGAGIGADDVGPRGAGIGRHLPLQSDVGVVAGNSVVVVIDGVAGGEDVGDVNITDGDVGVGDGDSAEVVVVGGSDSDSGGGGGGNDGVFKAIFIGVGSEGADEETSVQRGQGKAGGGGTGDIGPRTTDEGADLPLDVVAIRAGGSGEVRIAKGNTGEEGVADTRRSNRAARLQVDHRAAIIGREIGNVEGF